MINETCRQKRRAMELSQAELAKLAQTTQSTIANFEAGKTSITSKTLDRILTTLGLDVSEISTEFLDHLDSIKS